MTLKLGNYNTVDKIIKVKVIFDFRSIHPSVRQSMDQSIHPFIIIFDNDDNNNHNNNNISCIKVKPVRRIEKWKKDYEEKVAETRRNISIAKAEWERLKENRNITKKGRFLSKDELNLRPKYKDPSNTTRNEESGDRFDNNDDASSFWRELWKKRGTGNKDADWLGELQSAVCRCVPPHSEES